MGFNALAPLGKDLLSVFEGTDIAISVGLLAGSQFTDDVNHPLFE